MKGFPIFVLFLITSFTVVAAAERRERNVVGFIQAEHTLEDLEDIEVCSATSVYSYLQPFVLTAASCLHNKDNKVAPYIYFFPKYRKKIKFFPEYIRPDGIYIPKEWKGGKPPNNYNYAFLHFPADKMRKMGIGFGDYAVFSGFYTNPEGRPFTKEEIKENTMSFSLYGYDTVMADGKPVRYDPTFQFLGTILQNHYQLSNSFIDLGNRVVITLESGKTKTGNQLIADFWARGPSVRGAPLLYVNPKMGTGDPQIFGMMVDDGKTGKILLITQEIYLRFMQWAKTFDKK
ncbi:MAG: hypothetical protein HY559_05555 [Gammaproteobacteria bacterium]|nr:hypothetical protein [Gammaproteobacteria bacterium]